MKTNSVQKCILVCTIGQTSVDNTLLDSYWDGNPGFQSSLLIVARGNQSSTSLNNELILHTYNYRIDRFSL